MCLGEVGQLVEIRSGGRALVRTPDRTLGVSLVTLDDPVDVGDWVVAHSGFALARLSPAEARDALALRAGAPAAPPHVSSSSAPPLEGSA